jgi:hypothetical protein
VLLICFLINAESINFLNHFCVTGDVSRVGTDTVSLFLLNKFDIELPMKYVLCIFFLFKIICGMLLWTLCLSYHNYSKQMKQNIFVKWNADMF